MQILGVPIDNLSRSVILAKAKEWLASESFHRIATVNPEFLLLATENPRFKQSLLAADLRLADGVGLHLPFWLAGEKLVGHYPGADLLHDLVKLAEAKGCGVALALHEHGLSTPEEIKSVLLQRYPRLQLDFFSDTTIQDSRFKILLSNYGAPLQEIYLESIRQNQGSIRLAMGVGGAFDYLTGAMPRAPKMFQQFGLEWLWRLFQQPRRFRRIWNAVVVFPVKVLSQK